MDGVSRTLVNTKENTLEWKLITSNVNYEVRCLNNRLVEYIIHTEGYVTIKNAPQTLNGWIPEGYWPKYTISTPINHSGGFISFRSDGAVGYWTMTSQYSGKVNGVAYWRI